MIYTMKQRRSKERNRVKLQFYRCKYRWIALLSTVALSFAAPLSLAAAAGFSDGNSYNSLYSLSPDGRFLTYAIDSTNFVPGDTVANFEVYLRDLETGDFELVSQPGN